MKKPSKEGEKEESIIIKTKKVSFFNTEIEKKNFFCMLNFRAFFVFIYMRGFLMTKLLHRPPLPQSAHRLNTSKAARWERIMLCKLLTPLKSL